MNAPYSPPLVFQILEDCSQLPLSEVKQLCATRFSYTLLFLDNLDQLEEIYQLIQLIHTNIIQEKKEQQRWNELRKKGRCLNLKLKNPLYRLFTSKRELESTRYDYTQCQAEFKDIAAKHSLENFSRSSTSQICDLIDILEAIFGINNPLGSASHVLFSTDPNKLEHQVIYKTVQDFFSKATDRSNPNKVILFL